MRDDNANVTTDGGDADSPTFETLDWARIDAEGSQRSTKETVWYGFLALWVLGFGTELLSLYAVRGVPIEWPIVGEITRVTWLWVMTLATITYYGVIPLLENPRMTRRYWREFKKNTAAVISGLFLLTVFLIGVVGSFVTEPPTPTPGEENLPPAWMATESYIAGTNCPGGIEETDGGRLCTGSWEHPFGTTTSGEDLFRGVIHGMEVTMQVGLIATLISVVIAASVALTAVYYGGMVDEVLFRYVDLQLTFPAFFLYLLIVFTVGGSLFLLILVLGVLGWGGGARLMRSEGLQRREEPFIKAAKAAGASGLWTIRRHLLPNISNTIITYATLAIPGVILTEAALSFLGLADPTLPSWGRLIADGRDQLANAWWISTIPGVFLFLTVLAFNFLGDALRDALDPRQETGS